MKRSSNDGRNLAYIDQTISDRSGVGPNEMIRGWQSMLVNLFIQLGPHLRPSEIVTFHTLTEEEQHIFHRIVQTATFSSQACGVYLPPSVRNQLMYTNRGEDIPEEVLVANDDGVLLFSDIASHETIVNALLAHPPHAAAADVYQDGALVAGFVYSSTNECLEDIGQVVDTFFME